MNRLRGSSEIGLSTSIKVLINRFSYLFFVLAAFGIMLLSKADTFVVEKVSTIVVDVFSPLMRAVSEPAAAINDAVDRVHELANIREQNVLLRRENERLLVWKTKAEKLSAQNKSLQTLLNFKPDSSLKSITARVIANSGGAFVRSVVVNTGKSKGVRKGQAAVAGAGLVGRVASSGYQSARVLLITDINSRVPVLVGQKRDRAILRGDNTFMPPLRFLPVNASVELGDNVVTSGHGGVFPPGLKIGEIIKDSEGGFRVMPKVIFERLEFLRLIDFLPKSLENHTPYDRSSETKVNFQ